MTHVLAVLALAGLCMLWFAFQRWTAGRDPSIPGFERRCGACGGGCEPDHHPGVDLPAGPTARRDPGGAPRAPLALIVLVAALVTMACASVGHDFPVGRVPEIRIGETTRDDVRAMFGAPWRVGQEDGRLTWTYGKYRYKLFGESSTTDLVVRFDDSGTVVSYTFNTTEHAE